MVTVQLANSQTVKTYWTLTVRYKIKKYYVRYSIAYYQYNADISVLLIKSSGELVTQPPLTKLWSDTMNEGTSGKRILNIIRYYTYTHSHSYV